MSKDESSPQNLEGRRVLITGGTTGVGRATAARFASAGCRVFICGRNQEHLADAISAIRSAGGQVSGLSADLSSSGGVAGVFHAADEWMGPPEIVVLNAGIASHGELADMSHEECRQVIDINLLSYIHGALEALKRMKLAGAGQILMTGSMSAEIFDERAAVYVAAKSGIRGFAGSLRKEANQAGIRVSLIEPGSIGSDMVDETPEQQRRMQEEGRMLRAEDVARALFFIASQPAGCDVITLQVRPHLQLI